MSDPRNAAHAKKITQGKKHQGTAVVPKDAPPAQPSEAPTPAPVARLEASLVVLAQLKELEFHSRANLERLAEVTLKVDDVLKQKEMLGPLGEVYSAQSSFQTKLTTLIEAYKAECDRMQGAHA
jgi:hypothetical protein